MALKGYPEIIKGDIVLIKRKKYDGPFKYLITRLILFFTTAWWKDEPTSKVYHAELADSQLNDREFIVITMEPPKCRFKDRSYDRKIIFRLKYPPQDFYLMYDMYKKAKLGEKYDFIKILAFVLDFLTFGTFFTRHLVNKSRDICSEFVARFYEGWVRVPCSDEVPDSTAPDNILDYCLVNTKLFDKIYED